MDNFKTISTRVLCPYCGTPLSGTIFRARLYDGHSEFVARHSVACENMQCGKTVYVDESGTRLDNDLYHFSSEPE